MSRLTDGEIRPEWVLIPERFYECAFRYYCSQAAIAAISSLGDPETPMYSLAKTFESEFMFDSPRKQDSMGLDLHLGKRYLFRLDTKHY